MIFWRLTGLGEFDLKPRFEGLVGDGQAFYLVVEQRTNSRFRVRATRAIVHVEIFVGFAILSPLVSKRIWFDLSFPTIVSQTYNMLL